MLVKPPRVSMLSTTSTPVSLAKPPYMAEATECTFSPWSTMARTTATKIPAVKVGRVGFFRTIRTTTTMGGRSSRGERLNWLVTVLRMAS